LCSEIDMGRFPRLADLFELAKPYLEKNDFGIGHTKKVLEIARRKFQISPEIEELVLATIILHDTGGSSIEDQYEKGPKIAAELLKTRGYEEKIIKEVCSMIRTHHNRPEKPPEAFKILYDSDQLAKFSEEEFKYYSSRKNFNWSNIIKSLYFEHSKKIAIDMWKNESKRS